MTESIAILSDLLLWGAFLGPVALVVTMVIFLTLILRKG